MSVDRPEDAEPVVDTNPGPDTIGDAWIHSINPIDLMKDAWHSSESHLPFGIGFAIENPSVMASPEFLELAVLDPAVRVGRAAWDVGIVTPYNMLGDLGEAAKDVIDVGRHLAYAPIDLITLRPIEAVQDVGNAIWNGFEAVGHTAEALVVEPIKGIWTGINDII